MSGNFYSMTLKFEMPAVFIRYKKYELLDPLGVVTRIRTSQEEDDDGLSEAPQTIKDRERLDPLPKENYFYMPGMGEVPEIAVPDFLPDLAGKDIVKISFN